MFKLYKGETEMIHYFIYILFVCGLLVFYFLPSIIGIHKKNAIALFVFNLFLGWTGLGWVIALVWSLIQDE